MKFFIIFLVFTRTYGQGIGPFLRGPWCFPGPSGIPCTTDSSTQMTMRYGAIARQDGSLAFRFILQSLNNKWIGIGFANSTTGNLGDMMGVNAFVEGTFSGQAFDYSVREFTLGNNDLGTQHTQSNFKNYISIAFTSSFRSAQFERNLTTSDPNDYNPVILNTTNCFLWMVGSGITPTTTSVPALKGVICDDPKPSDSPTMSPTFGPTSNPTNDPTSNPTSNPTANPTRNTLTTTTGTSTSTTTSGTTSTTERTTKTSFATMTSTTATSLSTTAFATTTGTATTMMTTTPTSSPTHMSSKPSTTVSGTTVTPSIRLSLCCCRVNESRINPTEMNQLMEIIERTLNVSRNTIQIQTCSSINQVFQILLTKNATRGEIVNLNTSVSRDTRFFVVGSRTTTTTTTTTTTAVPGASGISILGVVRVQTMILFIVGGACVGCCLCMCLCTYCVYSAAKEFRKQTEKPLSTREDGFRPHGITREDSDAGVQVYVT